MSSENFYLYFMNIQRNVGPFPCCEMEDVFSLLRKKCRVFMRFNNSLTVKQIEDMITQKEHGAIAYNHGEQSMDFVSLEEYSLEGTASCPFMLVNLTT